MRVFAVDDARFRLLVEQITDYAIFLLDPSGHVMTWNAGAERFKGYTADEIVGKHFSTFYRPEDRWKCAPELDVARSEGRVEDESWRVRKDGALFWANVVITCLRDDSGEIVGFAKVTRDLTERRASEETLRRSEERFRLLVETVKDYAIFMLDPQGRVATWNVGAQRIKGYDASEIVGQHFSRFYPEEDVRGGKCELELEGAARDGRFEDEGWRIRKDGSRFWANVVITALRERNGELVGFAKVTRDLTERRAAEQERLRLGQLARERIIALTSLSEELAGALSMDEVAHAITKSGTVLIGADICTLYLSDEKDEQLRLIAEHGCDPRLVPHILVLSRASGSPFYPVGSGEGPDVWIENPEQYAAFAPALHATATDGARARAFGRVPLTAEGRTMGFIGVGFHAPRAFAEDERQFLRTFARQSAQALVRAKRLESERDAAALAE